MLHMEDAEINHYVLVLQLYFSQYMRHKERWDTTAFLFSKNTQFVVLCKISASNCLKMTWQAVCIFVAPCTHAHFRHPKCFQQYSNSGNSILVFKATVCFFWLRVANRSEGKKAKVIRLNVTWIQLWNVTSPANISARVTSGRFPSAVVAV